MNRTDTIAAAHHTHPATPSGHAACVAVQGYLRRQPPRRSTDDVRAGVGYKPTSAEALR